MPTTLSKPKRRSKTETLAEFLRKLGGIRPSRIRMNPPPGRATEKDILRIAAEEGRLFELVDGVLVEKVMATKESALASHVIFELKLYLRANDMGVVLGEAGMLRLRPKLVRIPDVSFVSWDQTPGGALPDEPIASLHPDLAVEVLSESNTPREMARKLAEYFEAGCRMVWIIDPETRTADVYTAADQCTHLRTSQSLDGGDVLPGFKLPLKELFASTRRR